MLGYFGPSKISNHLVISHSIWLRFGKLFPKIYYSILLFSGIEPIILLKVTHYS